ncbi:MAG: PAS domain S-box protein, partial [Desulfovibrionales bacterium]
MGKGSDLGLREKAERKVHRLTADIDRMDEDEIRRVVHELQVHQIELEIQNEELRATQEELHTSHQKYVDLFDFAPVGYLSLDRDGVIHDVNLTLCSMLGTVRSMIKGKRLFDYVTTGDRDVLFTFLRKAFRWENETETELRLVTGKGDTIFVQLQCMPMRDAEGQTLCRTSVLDITDSKKAEALEEYLRREEKQALMEESPDRVVRYDRGLRRVYMNRACALYNGGSVDHYLGWTLKEKPNGFDPDGVQKLEGVLREVLDSGQRRYLELAMDTAVGRRWFHVSVFPVRSPEGEVTSVLTIGRDMTERLEAEFMLRQSEERFRQMAENIKAVFWLQQGETLVYLSPAFEEIWGRSIDETHYRAGAFMEAVVAEDRERVRAAFETSLQTGEFNEEYRIRRPNGEIRWIHARSFPIRNGETGTHSAGIAEDITHRKNAELALERREQEYRTLAERTPDIVVRYDREFNRLFANKALNRLYGVEGDHQLEGSFLDAPLPSKVKQDFIRCIRQVIATGQEQILEAEFPSPLESRWFQLRFVPEVASEGEVETVLAIGRDVTALKGAQIWLEQSRRDLEERVETRTRELQQARESAEAANRAKSEFLANMSHEIRTPLAGILGLTELSLEQEMSGELVENLEMIRYSAQSLNTIINDLLDFSTIEAKRATITPTAFSLKDELSKITVGFEEQAAIKGLSFAFRMHEDAPDRIVTDPARLRQILINFLNNAVKFTAEGRVELIVRRPDPDHLTFSVVDTGIGIPPDRLDDIFKSFTQLDATITKRFGGTGLGLAISKNLAELMGGNITVASEPDKGSEFTLTLPVELPEEEQDAGVVAGPTLDELPPLRILLAEDNPVNQLVISKLLSERGHSVTAVADGRKALEQLHDHSFDLVLMDVQMPEMDGLDATRAIREGASGRNPATIPIIALTAYAMKGDRERFLAAGMDAYVSKPVDQSKLAEAIQAV